MGRVAVMASGSGSNFQAVCEGLAEGPHSVVGLICDQPAAYVLTRADTLGVPFVVVEYGSRGTGRSLAEGRMAALLREWRPDLIVLAGFMRVLSREFVREYPGKLVNIHPSLLPRYPGLHSIERSHEAGDEVVGITVHFVDDGIDTGEIIRQETLARQKEETLDDLESRIHELEHRTYPEVIRQLLENQRASGNREVLA